MNKHSEIVDVIVQDSNLVLDSALIVKIGAVAGDRITIGYIEKDGNMIPIIHKGEEGNKLTKSNTVSFRGKQRASLLEFGSNFWAGEFNGTYCELESDGIPVYTEVKKAAQSHISKEIVLDNEFNLKIYKKYEF